MGRSLIEQKIAQVGARAFFASLTPEQRKALPWSWRAWARPEQLAPPGDWTTWLIDAGRGFGKTRSGAEWVIEKARSMPRSRGFLAARTSGDVRDVMIEGESGILARSPPNFRPEYEPSKRRLTWPNGTICTTFSSDAGESGRGPQHHWGWADELAAWIGWVLWDNLQMGLRLGDHPQACVTTTPRPVEIIRELLKDPSCVVTRGSTYDNLANLPKVFFEKVLRKYEGTRLGRQELLAELLEDTPGALWQRAMLEALHILQPPELECIVVAIDPATTSGEDSDETGIVVAGRNADRDAKGRACGTVLEDLSCRESPGGWAKRAIDAFHRHKANFIIAEVNQGGEMVEATLRAVDADIPIRTVHARVGKRTRAEPVAALYEQGRVHHLWTPVTDPETLKTRPGLVHLEDQMVQYVPGVTKKSPDRMDAGVYALTAAVLDFDGGWLLSA